MPCLKKFDIDTTKPVLVTGGTGYVAGVLISQLVEKGVTVHATVRDPSKTDRLAYLQEIADNSPGSIKFFKADLTTQGSFEEAMKGCYAVFHTASPFSTDIKDPVKDLVEPAVIGTENVLRQCNKTPSVKRVVVTSSVVATYTDAAETKKEKPTDENIWNRTASISHVPYNYSKTVAEQTAWVIAGSQTQWRLCTINPSMIVGPGVKYHASSESYKIVKSFGSNDPNMALGIPNLGMACVDVRDVAAAHIAAAYLDEAGGRHILSGFNGSLPQMAQALKKYSKKYLIVTKKVPYFFSYLIWLVAPYTGQGIDREFVSKNWGYECYFDNRKSKEALGIEYRPMQDSVQEMYQQMIDLDVVSPKK
ncbi:Anthocyanidin reductase ((2S)-flavan-3-ol-forming) [Seminavis robusta]|uniref:Anthocyanidin reductase ((2S)-flavan-3-ol-forming) n=1 Tax=Seminavis robusta TaxID=568900 RepID=A0A9N8D4R6_9STRA|nr:Anthocyanidin reductase ((2S)-flavan-3-ol-forming) [Seminavis robusta]|eukprot:Sro1_g000230.1 Anthocyanidin reductase ((2S)-flavan-3-ol-forming) (363) ;mRNA; r:71796-72884